MVSGTIFNIQRFCINDGPGIRTTVFFKGCPLKCKWCHNPESAERSFDMMFSESKCVGCKRCAQVCDNAVHSFAKGHYIQMDKCAFCGKCTAVCPVNALEISGKCVTSDEVIRAVLADKEFFEDSGGGLTISGGEPFMQYDFLIDMLKKAKESALHVCIETSGAVQPERLLDASRYTDIFLFDYKLTDPGLHKEYVGCDNGLILQNLRSLDEAGSKIILRCPIIPGVNDTDEHFKGIAEVSERTKNVMGVEIAPYHELGLSKSARLSVPSNVFRVPEKEEAQGYIDQIKAYTDKPVKRM